MTADTEFREFVESLDLSEENAAPIWAMWDVVARESLWETMVDQSREMKILGIGAALGAALQSGMITPPDDGDGETVVMN